MSTVLTPIRRTSPRSKSSQAGEVEALLSHASIRSATHGQMVRSKLNVRRKEGDNLLELMALIRSQGLLQNLVGFEQLVSGVPSGMVEIVAGGRRLACIGRLIEDGDLPPDYQIPYLLVSADEGIAISLAENSGREPMHPADVFDAMSELARRGTSIVDIASAFGVDQLTVRRRLKLANVAPRFMQMYRDDQINFEQMAALAVSDDHLAQEQAWDSLDKWSREPYRLRRLLTAQQIEVQSDRVVRFVGVDAYTAAGGLVTRDLFSETGAGYVDDGALLERLAAAKLAEAAKSLEGKGHAWIDVRSRIDAAELANFAQARMSRREATAQEQAALDAVAAARAEIERQIDQTADEDGDTDALYERLDQLERERRAILEKLDHIHPADRSLAGALVTIDEQGRLLVRPGMIRPQDRKSMEKLAPSEEHQKSKERPVHSERLTTILTGHRTAALHAELMARPDLALVVLAHGLIRQVFSRHSVSPTIAQLRIDQASLPVEAEAGAAWEAVQAKRKALQERLPVEGTNEQSLMAWLMLQPQDVLMEFVAFSVGCSLNAVQTRESACPAFSELAAALQLDMSAWWNPTAANYFSHVSKSRTLEVVTAAVSADAAVPLETMKKSAAAEAAERALAGSGWLPDVFLPHIN